MSEELSMDMVSVRRVATRYKFHGLTYPRIISVILIVTAHELFMMNMLPADACVDKENNIMIFYICFLSTD
jgi:hypothetical protein